MTFSKFISASAIALSMSLSVACTANSADASGQKTTYANTYLKPGASVNYSYNLKSQLSPGETTTFQLTLKEYYKAGDLIVNLDAEGNIDLFAGSRQASFDMADSDEHVIDISFTPTANGRNYINVQALAVDTSGLSQPRIFSIPVQVGPPRSAKAKSEYEDDERR